MRAPRTETNQTAWTSSEHAADMLTRRDDRCPLANIVAHARKGRLVITTLFIPRPGRDLIPCLDEAGSVRVTASPSASSSGSAAPAETAASPKPCLAPTPAMVVSAVARKTARAEQGLTKKVETAPEPVDPPLSRFGVRQTSDLIDLLSSLGAACAFASLAARSRQSLTPWALMGGGSVTLVESLNLAVSDPNTQIDDEARLEHVRALAAECLCEHASPAVLSVARTARDAITEGIRAYASAPVTSGETPCLRHDQALVARVGHAGDSLAVAALETHGITAKDPAAHARKASKRY